MMSSTDNNHLWSPHLLYRHTDLNKKLSNELNTKSRPQSGSSPSTALGGQRRFDNQFKYIPREFNSDQSSLSFTVSPRFADLNGEAKVISRNKKQLNIFDTKCNAAAVSELNDEVQKPKLPQFSLSGYTNQAPLYTLYCSRRSSSNHGIDVNGSGRINDIKRPSKRACSVSKQNIDNNVVSENKEFSYSTLPPSSRYSSKSGVDVSNLCIAHDDVFGANLDLRRKEGECHSSPAISSHVNRNDDMLKILIDAILNQQSPSPSARPTSSGNGFFSKQSGRLTGSIPTTPVSRGNIESLSHQFRGSVNNCYTHIVSLLNACEDFVDKVDNYKIEKEASSAAQSKGVRMTLMRLAFDIKCMRRIVKTELSELMTNIFRDISAGSDPNSARKLRSMSSVNRVGEMRGIAATSLSSSASTSNMEVYRQNGVFFVKGIGMAYMFLEQLHEIGDHLLSSAKKVADSCPSLGTEIGYLSLLRNKLSEVATLALKYTDTSAVRLPAGESLKRLFTLKRDQNNSNNNGNSKVGQECSMMPKQQLPAWFLDFHAWLRSNISTIQECKEALQNSKRSQYYGASRSSDITDITAHNRPVTASRKELLSGHQHAAMRCTPSTPGEYCRLRTAAAPLEGPHHTIPKLVSEPQQSLKDVISADEAKWEVFSNNGGLQTLGVEIERIYNTDTVLRDTGGEEHVKQLLANVPWPMTALHRMSSMLNISALRGKSLKARLLPLSTDDTRAMSEYIKVLQRRWHPDRFHNVINIQRGDRLKGDSQTSSLLRQATRVSQTINVLKDFL